MVWGRIIRRCGSMGGLLSQYVFPSQPAAALEAARCVASLPWILKAQVRGEGAASAEETLRAAFGVKDGASNAVVEFLINQPPGRLPQALNFRLRAIIAAVAAREYANSASSGSSSSGGGESLRSFMVAHRELEVQLGELETVVGICNRLRGSPVPPGYTRHLSRALSLWLFTLPLGFVGSGARNMSTPAIVVVAMCLSYVLVGIDVIGTDYEDAFSLLPLQQMAAVSQLNAELHMSPRGGPMPPVPC